MSHEQELFDRVAEHLITQNERAITLDQFGHGICAYRGTKGTKCAVGALISDEFYTPELENLAFHTNQVLAAVTKSLGFELTAEEHCLLQDLQRIHDAYEPDEWRRDLRNMAANHNLDMPECIQ